jgi:hypothetical protein
MELKRREVSSREQEECRDVLAFEQPSAAQKFSAQEFLKQTAPSGKKRNKLADHAGCSKVSTSGGER